MFDTIVNVINQIDKMVWGWWMILLLLGTHIFMTFRTGFIQRHSIGKGIRLSVTRDPEAEGEVSTVWRADNSFGGNDWYRKYYRCWYSDRYGWSGSGPVDLAERRIWNSDKYSEALIAVKYRVKTEDGRMQGGAFYALERGLNMKWLGMLFAILAGFASFGIGCATQVNAIATVAEENFNIPPLPVGL